MSAPGILAFPPPPTADEPRLRHATHLPMKRVQGRT
jgi:hypothetical protein